MGQTDLSGKKQYPQFRTSSGLPGSGLTVDKDGRVGRDGAASLSIPVAYSLGKGTWVGGVSYTSDRFRFRSPNLNSEKEAKGNGTGWLMTGFDGAWGKATIGVMVLSSKFDNVINLQYTAPVTYKGFSFGAGVQDLLGDGGSGGETNDLSEGGGNSRSLFVASTWNFAPNWHATAGIGSNRFRFGFAGLSWNVVPRLNLNAEHDGYNFNAQAAYSLGKLGSVQGRDFTGAISFGAVRGKYLHLSAVFGF